MTTATTVDLLMSRVEEINAITNPADLTDDDIRTLVLHFRRLRARRAAGIKDDIPKPQVNLKALLNLPDPQVSTSIPSISSRRR